MSSSLTNSPMSMSMSGMPSVNPSQGAPPSDPINQSSLPMPPQAYVSCYSDENVKRGRAPRPPPIPAQHETYMVFGTTYHADDAIIRPLESQGIRRLYPQNLDHRRELKKMNHSVLANFLDLLDILIHCPDSPKRQEKIDDISLLFIHMHHLINEFRPHQARETLRVMMEVQKRQTLETCERFQKHLEMSVEIIKQALSNLPEQLDAELKDIKYSIPTEIPKPRKYVRPKTNIATQDQLMCDIVDSL